MKDDLRISKLFILYDSERNPLRSLLTYALDDATFRMSIIAVAARHFSISNYSFEQFDDALAPPFAKANLDALHFKRRAIQLLLSSLSNTGTLQKKTTLLAAILFLIFLDILESGLDGWQCHLLGAKSLIDLSHTLSNHSSRGELNSCSVDVVEDTKRFVEQQFAL
jgi:hypothetical protein